MSLDKYGFEMGYVETSDKKARVIELLKADPDRNYSRIAEDVGCTPAWVNLIARKQLKLPKRRAKGLAHWSKREKSGGGK